MGFNSRFKGLIFQELFLFCLLNSNLDTVHQELQHSHIFTNYTDINTAIHSLHFAGVYTRAGE